MTNENDSLVERSTERLPSLAVHAAKLNETSKILAEVVERIDDALQRLNLGVTAWVPVRQVNNAERGGSEFLSEALGYSRLGRSWGLVLKKSEGDLADDDPQMEQWPFNEAPRNLRIRAVKKIPDLLAALDRQAKVVTEEIILSINETVPLVKAIEESAAPQRPIKKNRRSRS